MRGRKNDRFQFTLSVCVNKAHLRIIQFSQLARGHQNFSACSDRIDSISSLLFQKQKGFILCICALCAYLQVVADNECAHSQYTEWILCLRIAGWVSERAGGHQSMSPRGAPASNNMRPTGGELLPRRSKAVFTPTTIGRNLHKKKRFWFVGDLNWYFGWNFREMTLYCLYDSLKIRWF
jgi:hypothetical protein